MLRTAIVGAGPIGLACAHLLARQGQAVTLVERKAKLATHPSAHVIHPRAGEILRDIGVAEDMRKTMMPEHQWRRFNYVASIAGALYRSYDNLASVEFERSQSLSDMQPMHFPQHKLVDLLHSKLPHSVRVMLSTEVVDLSQNNSSVKLITRKGDVIEADYVLACDGANSSIRQRLGIPLHGTDLLQTFLNIHFLSHELGEMCKERPAMINFVYNSKIIAALISHSLEEGEFIMQVPFLLSFDKISSLENDDYEDMVNSVAGVVLKDVKIKSVIPWKMGAQWAEDMQRHRVFLVGDSAHRMPPTGGFGMCTGFSDARNICWKLAHPQLHGTYASERLQVVQRIVQQSVARFHQLTAISSSCNLNYSMFSAVKGISSWLPFGDVLVQSSIQVGEMLFSDSNLSDFLSDDSHLLRLIYPEEDLQQRYQHGFFTPTGGALAPNFPVTYKGEQYRARALPAVLEKETGKPVFVYLKGRKVAELPDNIPIHTVDVEGDQSYVLRPDSILYSKSI